MKEADQQDRPITQDKARFFAEDPNDLTRSQRNAIRHFIESLLRITDNLRTYDPKRGLHAKSERPHQVFLLDGGRGAGKTYSLLTIEHVINELTRLCEGVGEQTRWSAFFLDNSEAPETSRLIERERTAARGLRVAETVKIIFQSDLVDKESIMETIFGHLSEQLRKELSTLERQLGADRQTHAFDTADESDRRRRRERIDALIERLNGEVAQGWFFARRFGTDALIRDSFDYTDMVGRWTDESRKAANRIDNWRKLIEEYLDVRGAASFVVLLDDSDVNPSTTAKAIEDIRIFLSHPRVITVLAGNLRTMRESLLHERLRDIAPSIPTLNNQNNSTATDWRRRIRQLVEEYLEKVLPPARRLHISRPETYQSVPADDFRCIAGRSLRQYVDQGMQVTRLNFLSTKFRLALQHLLGDPDVPSSVDRGVLDGFLSWWFFANFYADSLAPHSPRQIENFKQYYSRLFDRQADSPPKPGLKRLPVVLLENPANFQLLHRFGDEDASVLDWLRHQHLSSSWTASRWFRINQREIHDGSYSHTFLRYRLDLGLGLPVRYNGDEVIPVELLPQLKGRQFMRRFLQPRATPRRQRTLGVGRLVNHAALPGNCTYLHDVQALPDLAILPADAPTALRERQQSGAWEAQLAERWFELLDDNQETAADERAIRYFREIVCQSLHRSENISSAQLVSALDPPDILEKQSIAIYEHFIEDELALFRATAPRRNLTWLLALKDVDRSNRKIQSEIEELRGRSALLGRVGLDHGPVPRTASEGAARAPLRMIALYSALVTDLRRAWHAIRISEVSPGHVGGVPSDGRSEVGQKAVIAVVRSRDRMSIYDREDIENTVLRRSPWVAAMLDVFSHGNLEPQISKYFSDDNTDDLTPAGFNRLFLTGNASSDDALQVVEEPLDFKRWTGTVRAIGRLCCAGWPVGDLPPTAERAKKLQEARKDFESGLFGPTKAKPDSARFMLRILKSQRERDAPGDASKPIDPPGFQDQLKQNARSARNFVWLMYGLAPSLSAVIHTQIMSTIYEAETLKRAARASPEGGAADQPSEGPSATSETELAARVASMKRLLGSSTELTDRANRMYQAAFAEIRKWSELVGTLSVMFRYVKIKCLHLDTALLLKLLAGETQSAAAEPASLLAAEDRRRALIRQLGYEPEDQPAPDQSRQFFAGLARLFHHLALEEQLAIFPDVAPSTLLGDDWLRDILTRKGLADEIEQLANQLGFRKLPAATAAANTAEPPDEGQQEESKRDDPLSVSGMFGETELWLWATSRTLRKLHVTLSHHQKMEMQPAPDEPPRASHEPA